MNDENNLNQVIQDNKSNICAHERVYIVYNAVHDHGSFLDWSMECISWDEFKWQLMGK